MYVSTIILGLLCFYFGFSLIFRFQAVKAMSEKLNKLVMDENQLFKYRYGIGLLLLGLSIFLFVSAYYVATYIR